MEIENTADESSPAVVDQFAQLAGDPEIDIEIMQSVPKEFAIDSHDRANWLVRKVVAARAYALHVKEWAEQEQRRAEREEKTLMFLFGRQLEAWAKAEIAGLGGRRKSLALPAGTVGYRQTPLRLVVDDEKAVLAWARDHCPAAVVITSRLSKSTLDEFVKSTGMIPEDGAHVDPVGERFYVR